MDIFGILTMVGGLALFLYGMNAMGDGLAKLSGGRLERILERLTSNRIKALLLGALVTAVIQSSSATTVMVVGFVNSGIMQLKQAVGIIMGANIGTTITSWLLSLTGIQGDNIWIKLLKPSSFSPILAVIGIILTMFAKNDDKKKEFDSRETAMFNELDKIVENQIPALDTGFKDEIYYQVGEIYLNYYKCSEGKLDDTYIKNRNEEAAQRFAKISETYDAAVLRYTKGICSISNVEKMFSKAETGFSDNENTISEENKIEAWDSMAEAVSAEERYANKVNLYLIVGDIVYGQREEFRVISDEDKKNEIIEFCQSAVSYLNDEANVENVKSSSIESINMKRDKAKTYYEGIYEALAQKEMEG